MQASIIFPLRINSPWEQSLRALGKQDFTGRFEILVIINKQDSIELEQIYSVNQNNIRVLCIDYKENIGKTYNTAMEAARGDVIIFSDPAVIPCSNFISEHMRVHRLKKDVMVISFVLFPVEIEQYNDAVMNADTLRDSKRHCFHDDFISRYLLKHSYNVNANSQSWLLADLKNISCHKDLLLKTGGISHSGSNTRLQAMKLAKKVQSKGGRLIINDRANVYNCRKRSSFVTEELLTGLKQLMKTNDKNKEPPATLIENLWKKDKDSLRGEEDFIIFMNPENSDKVKDFILKKERQKKDQIVLIDLNRKTDMDLWVQHIDVECELKYYSSFSIMGPFIPSLLKSDIQDNIITV